LGSSDRNPPKSFIFEKICQRNVGGLTQDIVLSRFPWPIFPCPFSPYQKQDGRQKNGGKKISFSYIFASISLPFSVRLAIRSRLSLMFGCGLPRWVLLRQKFCHKNKTFQDFGWFNWFDWV
jgi:hypothetical protein